jgi:proteasome lid subunit RPN8/RPN11
MILQEFLDLIFRRNRPSNTAINDRDCRILMTSACVNALDIEICESRDSRHEGILYLLGQTDGHTTLAVAVCRPTAKTTRGSFHVEQLSMAKVVRIAAKLHLKVVGQLHTHPGAAYHSDGDIEGARIRYDGFCSIVLPNYGAQLPSFEGAATYFYRRDRDWLELNSDDFFVIKECA